MLRRLSGESLIEISNILSISPERARQIVLGIYTILGFESAKELSEAYQNELNLLNLNKEKLIVQKLIDKQKKIPNSDDEMPDYIDDHEIWKNLTNANLLERLNIYKKCEIAIPREEYDYHYLSINQGNENFKLGTGYFKDINNLKEYLFRHAQFLDEPDLMPKQTEIPRRVSSYVQQHGGQYIVSQKIVKMDFVIQSALQKYLSK